MTSSFAPYCGGAPAPAEWLARWNGDPLLLIAMALLGAIGWRYAPDRPTFGIAVATLVLLFVSPLCALTSALFSARVVHHVLLVGVAAPLLARAFDLRVRNLAAATVAGTAIFYAWHIPALYDAALSSDTIYWLMTIALLGSATAFWSALRAAPAPASVAALLTTMVAMGLLGALLTFAATPIYTFHAVAPFDWGMTPLEDQQLAGLIMSAPAAGLYLAAALAISWRAIGPPRAATS